MTRRGKCDTCRLRKVKCDQGRPCGACSKKGRSCTYEAASFFEESCDPENGSSCFSLSHPDCNVPRSTAYSTRSLHGILQKFISGERRQDLARTARLLSSDDSRRAARWIAIITVNPNGWSWFDRFMCSATTLIGSQSVIDRAIDFTMESHAAIKHKWHPILDRSALATGIEAMAALRHVLDAAPTLDNSTIVTTIGLLCVAEFFRAMAGIKNYVVHMQACATLLASQREGDSCTELEETLLYMVFLEEVAYSILRGRRSVFTVRMIPSMRSLAKDEVDSGFSNALSTTMKLLTGLSELGVLLHGFEEHCEDHLTIMKVVTMMQSLYEAGDEVEAHLAESATIIPAKCMVVASVLPMSYSFPSAYEFDLAVHYFTYRILLCGMIQSFFESLGSNEPEYELPRVTLAAVQQEEENLCRKIAMCIEYSHKCTGALFVPLRFVSVLRNAHASLQCIQARKKAEGFLQASDEAARLKELCYQGCAKALGKWGMAFDDMLLNNVMDLHTKQSSDGISDRLAQISTLTDP